METILDHNPTPFEMHHLGFTDAEDSPITDELRALLLEDDGSGGNWVDIAELYGMRGDRVQRDAYLQRAPADNWRRISCEEMAGEWDPIYPLP